MVVKALDKLLFLTLLFVAGLISICNVDWVLAPFMASPFFGAHIGAVSLKERVLIVTLVSFIGANYVYWFARFTDRRIRGYEEKGQTLAVLESSPRWQDQRRAAFIRRHQKLVARDNIWAMRMRNYGWPLAMGVGLVPEFITIPFMRTTLITFCAIWESRQGFVVYLAAEAAKNLTWGTLWAWLWIRFFH